MPFPRTGILTISDRSFRGERQDVSGRLLLNQVESQGWKVLWSEIIPDETELIEDTLSKWADSGEINVILTTGGTGFGLRDVTPEATQRVIERETPGLAEAMRAESRKITPHGMLSRGITGIRGQTLIINLPGSPKAALENLDVVIPVIPQAIQLLQDDEGAEAGHKFPSPE